MEWEESRPCSRCGACTNCSGPCKSYNEWLDQEPKKIKIRKLKEEIRQHELIIMHLNERLATI